MSARRAVVNGAQARQELRSPGAPHRKIRSPLFERILYETINDIVINEGAELRSARRGRGFRQRSHGEATQLARAGRLRGAGNVAQRIQSGAVPALIESGETFPASATPWSRVQRESGRADSRLRDAFVVWQHNVRAKGRGSVGLSGSRQVFRTESIGGVAASIVLGVSGIELPQSSASTDQIARLGEREG